MDTNLPTLKYRTYVRSQNTEWITFIHGAGGSSTIWHKQIKFFKKDYNLLLIDLRGHGMSNELEIGSDFKYHMIFEEIIEVLNYLKIHKSNFMGVSFGSVIIPHLHQRYPDRVDKMILAGAITGFDARTQFLLNSVHVVKFLLSNILLYKLFAWIIMPKSNHSYSRKLFVNEAKKIKNRAFRKWLSLLPEIKISIDQLVDVHFKEKTLFISGKEDYLFIQKIEQFVKDKPNLSFVKVNDSGHIINIDNHETFNRLVFDFIQ